MKKSVIFLLHAAYWTLFIVVLLSFFLFITMATLPRHDPFVGRNFINWIKLMTGFAIIPGIVAYYSACTFLFSHFLSKKRIAALLIAGTGIALLSALTGAGINSLPFLYGPHFLFPANDGLYTAFILIAIMAVGAFINGCFGLMIKGFITWYNEIKVKEELNKKHFELELSLVKSQLDPHFLFNTINNIDILIESEPLTASAYLNKLSEIMRFMLYETKTASIPLSQEIAYLEKYVALQKIRSANTGYVYFEVTGVCADLLIAPMLYIPFVENAFKYVADKKTGKAINIQLRIEKDKLIFICENNYLADQDVKIDEAGGIGISLIKRRLSLLYPNHQLTVNKAGNIYHVELIIKTNEL